MVETLNSDERCSVLGQARGILQDRPRLRGRYRDDTGRCCLVGALATAYENVFGETILVQERCAGRDVWVIDGMGEDLMGLFCEVHDKMPGIDCTAEYLPDREEDILSALVQYSDAETRTDAEIDALLARAAGEAPS